MTERANPLRWWARILALGQTAGSLLALAGLPAGLFGIVVFSQEIRDYVTQPDIGLSIERITIRCAYTYSTNEEANRVASGDSAEFVRICDRAPLAVSFRGVFNNTDAIERQVTALSARLSSPGREAPVNLRLAREVEQVITNGASGNVRRPWSTLNLAPNEARAREAWISPADNSENLVTYKGIRENLNDSEGPFNDGTAVVEILGTIPGIGSGKPRVLRRCKMVFETDALRRYRDLAEQRQLQFTTKCQEAN